MSLYTTTSPSEPLNASAYIHRSAAGSRAARNSQTSFERLRVAILAPVRFGHLLGAYSAGLQVPPGSLQGREIEFSHGLLGPAPVDRARDARGSRAAETHRRSRPYCVENLPGFARMEQTTHRTRGVTAVVSRPHSGPWAGSSLSGQLDEGDPLTSGCRSPLYSRRAPTPRQSVRQ